MFDMTQLMFRVLSACLLAGALTLSNVAFAQERENPLSAIGKLFGGGDRPQQGVGEGGAQPVRESPSDQAVRIERLEAQIRQLTGTIEQLQYRNQQLEQQVRAAGGGQPSQAAAQPAPQQPPRTIQSVPSQALPPTAAPAPAPQGGRRSDVFDPTQNPNAPGVPQTLGSIHSSSNEPPPVAANEPPVGVPGGRGAGAPLDLSTLATGIPGGSQPSTNVASAPMGNAPQTGVLPAPPPRNMSGTGANTQVASTAPPSETAQGYYDLAYGYVLRKDYAFAEDAFQAFIRKYPNDARIGDAQFWLGESLVPAPALRCRGGSLPRGVDEARPACEGARRAVASRPVAGRAQSERDGLRHARGGRPQISEGVEQCEAGRRSGTEACPLLTTRRSPRPKRNRCSPI